MATKRKRRSNDEITIQNQKVCAEYYAKARSGEVKEGIHPDFPYDSAYWQRSAEHHFYKVAYMMGFIDELLAS